MLFTNTYTHVYANYFSLIKVNKKTEQMLYCLDKHLLKPNILSDSFGLNLDSI